MLPCFSYSLIYKVSSQWSWTSICIVSDYEELQAFQGKKKRRERKSLQILRSNLTFNSGD